MITADWVRIAAFIGNAILFYASYRNQRWAQTQARLEESAARTHSDTAKTHQPDRTAQDGPKSITQADLDRLAAEFASRPYFDQTAYRLLCIGFAITAIASLIDIIISFGKP